ncbi:hypothetical protein [Conexibacter sp. CPCC 206217]|uniref:hypothetical protein n=1 Tax=Conexibacter sp. CPCC 206217 TaxID=3064574 RepID=UPI00271F9CE4|nr:hypothetical protein [Conexibacter sp. CPCC 206217]MDO8210281.1 hypothetical protein [Conexibacter sp. CPCC 206217]
MISSRPHRAPARVAACGLLAALATALLLLAFAPRAAHADVPPAPDCMYYVAGCDPIYGTATTGSGQVVAQGATVRLDSGQVPEISFDTPVNPSCVGDPFQICVYWSIAWKIQPPIGGGPSPVAIQTGCGANQRVCEFRYTTSAIGDYGDYWQPLVAALQRGSFVQQKAGYLIYARPRWRWVTITSPGNNNYTPLTAYAFKNGTRPAYGACLDANSIQGGVVPANLECVKVSGTGGSTSTSPAWRFPLPSGSGGWTIYPGLYPRGEAGPATTVGQRFTAANVSVADSDLDLTVSPLPVPSLDVSIDTGGSLLGLGEARTATITARAVGGQAPLTSVGWYLTVLARTGSATAVTNEDAPWSVVLMPGESARATATITGRSYGTDTFGSRVEARNLRGDYIYGTAPNVTVTVSRDAPPPTRRDDPSGGRPRPPIPLAAQALAAPALSGRVEDQVRTTYSVSWYAAASCGASDGEAHLLGMRDVTTDAAGAGDASIVPLGGPVVGEAVFGYSTLGGVRSDRSACVTARAVPAVALDLPASGVAGGAGVVGAVTVTAPGAVASGAVHLLDASAGGVELASATLVGGRATIALPSTLGVGAHRIVAVYDGDALVIGGRSGERELVLTAGGGAGGGGGGAGGGGAAGGGGSGGAGSGGGARAGAGGARAGAAGRAGRGTSGSATVGGLKLAWSASAPRAGRAFTLTVRLRRGGANATGGSVTVRRGRRTVAGPARVRRGAATLRLRLPRGRQTLTLVYTPSKPARPVTSAIRVTVAR